MSRSINAREKLYKDFIKAKDEKAKKDCHKMYKELRNQIPTKCRNSKKEFFQNFFIKNANDVKNMWRGINSIINVKSIIMVKTSCHILIIEMHITISLARLIK